MRYWWVNHKQTFAQEVGNGFLWSPKTSQGNAFNQFYENMTLANVGDVIFSYAGGHIRAVGVVKSLARELVKPEFGGKGENWSNEGWFLEVEFDEVPVVIRPKDHMQVLAPLLPEKYSPIRPTGDGNQGVYLAAISS